jgi:iron complex outermembrane receptor protein
VAADQAQPIDEVSKTVNIITGQEMRERADFSLVESLRSIPGFRIQQLGGFGRTASIKARGLRNQDTAILLDGVRLRDAAAITGDASPFLSDITLTSVSRVEVLRGSGSSLYGTNAIGGTVNFITPSPQAGPHGQVSYASGGLGFQRLRGNFTDAMDNGKFGFNLAVARTAYTKGIDGNDDSFNTNFQTRLHFQPTPNTIISGRFFISDAFVRLNSNPDTFGTLPTSKATVINARPGVNFISDADDPDNTQKSKFFLGHGTLTQVVRPDLVLTATYSGLRTSRKNDNGPLGAGFQSTSTSIFDGLIQTTNASMNWTPKYQSVKIGYEFEHEKYGNDGRTPSGTGNFFTRAYQSSNTIFAQDLISIYGGRLQFAGGLRVQTFHLEHPKFSLANAPYSGVAPLNPPTAYTFDGAASYFFRSTDTKIRAHVGNGYRVPSLYERFGTFFSSFGKPGFIALGDPNLKPERTIALDFGIEQNLLGDKGRLSAVYFYTHLIDTIGYGNVVPDIGSTPRPFGGYLNTKGGIARGGEFSGNLKPTNSTDFFASYTITKSLQREPQIAGSGILTTLGIPEHQFTLVATQRYERFWVNFDLLISSSYLAPIFSNSVFRTYVYRFEGNRRGDLTAGYTFKLNKEKFDLRLFGTIENVFDNAYYENGFRKAGRNGRIGLSFGF